MTGGSNWIDDVKPSRRAESDPRMVAERRKGDATPMPEPSRS
ncbi:MAG: hypothetical protein KatS3mg060_0579 [Dehalococcoidia bacterium]|nr:MAG: hypothetical protein KatS3mg060_0579 [Dehalococcoidia bacterium]